MADEGKELRIPHVEATHFRSIFANGAIFTSPGDGAKNWLITFYSEGNRIVAERLVAADIEGAFRNADPPRIETQRIRLDEVCVIMPESQVMALFNALAGAMKGGSEK